MKEVLRKIMHSLFVIRLINRSWSANLPYDKSGRKHI